MTKCGFLHHNEYKIMHVPNDLNIVGSSFIPYGEAATVYLYLCLYLEARKGLRICI